MKRLLTVLSCLPVILMAQNSPEFQQADREFCMKTMNRFGFDSVYSKPYSLAGVSYPELSRTLFINVTTYANDSVGWVTYEPEITKTVKRIGKDYGSMQLSYYPDEKETRIIVLVKFNKDGFKAGKLIDIPVSRSAR